MVGVVSRREVLKGAGAACALLCCAGCRGRSAPVSSRAIRLARAGELPQGTKIFQVERVALLRDERGFAALSLVCTHQGCLVSPAEGQYACSCHGARFDSEGAVLQGPATEPLPWLKLEIREGDLFVFPSEHVESGWRLATSLT